MLGQRKFLHSLQRDVRAVLTHALPNHPVSTCVRPWGRRGVVAAPRGSGQAPRRCAHLRGWETKPKKVVFEGEAGGDGSVSPALRSLWDALPGVQTGQHGNLLQKPPFPREVLSSPCGASPNKPGPAFTQTALRFCLPTAVTEPKPFCSIPAFGSATKHTPCWAKTTQNCANTRK